MPHLLLTKAFRYRLSTDSDPSLANYRYDINKGYWINLETGKALVQDDKLAPPRTKKEDIETGEDRKGE